MNLERGMAIREVSGICQIHFSVVTTFWQRVRMHFLKEILVVRHPVKYRVGVNGNQIIGTFYFVIVFMHGSIYMYIIRYELKCKHASLSALISPC